MGATTQRGPCNTRVIVVPIRPLRAQTSAKTRDIARNVTLCAVLAFAHGCGMYDVHLSLTMLFLYLQASCVRTWRELTYECGYLVYINNEKASD
jgi:ABC-type uncharacterized transport system permease subunit